MVYLLTGQAYSGQPYHSSDVYRETSERAFRAAASL